MSIEKFESEVIKPKLAGRRGSAVSLPRGGNVYVRAPSNEEFMMLQSQSDAPHDVYVPVYASYVKMCVLGACDAEGSELTFEQVREIAGPAWVSTGPLGVAVNRLAGNREAVTRDL